MTVYDFMAKMGEYEEFEIVVGVIDVTAGEKTCLHDVKVQTEDRKEVLDALERPLEHVDADSWILYC